jgi:hypothetical protein
MLLAKQLYRGLWLQVAHVLKKFHTLIKPEFLYITYKSTLPMRIQRQKNSAHFLVPHNSICNGYVNVSGARRRVVRWGTMPQGASGGFDSQRGQWIFSIYLILPRGTLYPQKLAITSPTSGGRSVGTVRSRTQTMEFVCLFFFPASLWPSVWLSL